MASRITDTVDPSSHLGRLPPKVSQQALPPLVGVTGGENEPGAGKGDVEILIQERPWVVLDGVDGAGNRKSLRDESIFDDLTIDMEPGGERIPQCRNR